MDVERDELARGGRATEYHPIPLRRVAGILHAEAVLIGEEVGHALIWNAGTEHVLRGGDALVERVRPVLDAYTSVQERVPRTGYIARREHARHVGFQACVDDNATVHVEPRGARQLDARFSTDADDNEI